MQSEIDVAGYKLSNCGTINILIGKNGCGKSTLLKFISQLPSNDVFGKVSYIIPERAGVLGYSPNLDSQVYSSQSLADTRRQNQVNNFKNQSASQFRKLGMYISDEIEKNLPDKRFDKEYEFSTFSSRIDLINNLLDNIYIVREGVAFGFRHKKGQNLSETYISSGESELISLAIELMVFQHEAEKGKTNIILLDEPDVHLHPDLQGKFAKFIIDLIAEKGFNVFIATHSTPLISSFSIYPNTRIAFMKADQKEIIFKELSSELKRIIPVFGAHPLSSIFIANPIMLVEGEDEERIWQHAYRSANGKIRVHPCSVNSKSELAAHENLSIEIMNSIYDNPLGYSLRDRDDDDEEISDIGHLIRFRLSCRTSENLIVSNEVLAELGFTFDLLEQEINKWLGNYPDHKHFNDMKKFKEDGFNRKSAHLKKIRNDLMGIMQSSAPWEAIVGQTIAKLAKGNYGKQDDANSISSYLGPKIVSNLLS